MDTRIYICYQTFCGENNDCCKPQQQHGFKDVGDDGEEGDTAKVFVSQVTF